MILKIQDPLIVSRWIYYDNIARISLNHNEYMITESNMIFPKKAMDNDHPEVEKSHELDADGVYAVWSKDEELAKTLLTIHSKNSVIVAIFRTPYEPSGLGGMGGDEMCVVFNCQAYLLNNEGKTIERIS